jgi:hypothetical protein
MAKLPVPEMLFNIVPAVSIKNNFGGILMKHFKGHKVFYGWLKRFTITHAVTYLLFGLIFMNLMGYEKTFNQNEYFVNFRPLDSPIVQAAVLFQLLRGAFFALILFPYRERMMKSGCGWLMLFSVIFGMTAIGTVNASPGSIEGLIYTNVSLRAHLVGMPEVICQALGFSVLFWLWEKRAFLKQMHS